MKLTDQKLKALRNDILSAAREMPLGIPVPMLQSVLGALLYKLPEDGEGSLAEHLGYLEGKGLLVRVPQNHTPSLEVWKLTADGLDYLQAPR